MIAGRYTLEREVGRGGMGAVWLARDEVLGRTVAMKRLTVAGPDEQHVGERAMREARVSAMLNHPNVVAVYDLIEDGTDHWLVMEYVESRNVGAMVRGDGPLALDEVASIGLQASRALATAHAYGIVHRDVKPSNILVAPDGRAKLSDFGIARADNDPSLTQTGMVTGSPAYLAPEIASGRSANSASDVWSLGATLFHMIEGRPPYDVNDNLMGALYRIVNEEPPRSTKAGWLAPLLEGTMERDPEQRWTTEQVVDFLHTRGSRIPASLPRSVGALSAAGAGAGAAAATDETSVFAAEGAAERTGRVAASDPVRSGGSGSNDSGRGTGSNGSRSTQKRRRRRTGLWAALAALVLATVAVGAFLTLTNRADDADQAAPVGGETSTRTTNAPSKRPSSPSPTAPSTPTSSATSPTPAPGPMRSFASSYIQTAASDPQAGFSQLTPEYQSQSNGFSGYNGWWKQIRSANATNVSADPGAMTVSYTVNYVMKSGERRSENVTLQLVQDNEGNYLIAGQA